MANGFMAFLDSSGRPGPVEYQLGDYRNLMDFNQFRLRRLRVDVFGDVTAPELRLQAQTEKPGHRFGFTAEFRYDPTPEADGVPWGFQLTTGKIWTFYHGPETFTDTHSWYETIRDGEEEFHARLHRRGRLSADAYLAPAPGTTTEEGAMRFGGRQVLRESIRTSVDEKTRRWTIFVTDDSYFGAAEGVECVCCGDEVAPLDATTGKPLQFDGDPFCVTCWKDFTARETDVDPSEVTPPATLPRFLLLHQGNNAPAYVEAVQIDPANPFRSTDNGTYNFATQEWICSAPRIDNGEPRVCGTTLVAANPSDWSRCPQCGTHLVMT